MRKLSTKTALRLTLYVWLLAIFFLYFSYGRDDPGQDGRFFEKVFVGISFTAIAWAVYGIACLLARKGFSCADCKFSERLQDSEELKCGLTGYTYPATYSCKRSRGK